VAASLWRRVGLRITESLMLDVRDWRQDLGEFGNLHVRFGKGSRGRGAKTRLVPAINGVAQLLDWWLSDVRHQFGDDWRRPDAPLLPSERYDRVTGYCAAGWVTMRCARVWRRRCSDGCPSGPVA
jgi:site-specific recombinase XerD